MPSLVAAHRGYEYQDLLVACRLVDVLLGSITEAIVDRKLVEDDRFDDLTVTTASGGRERAQFKHTENDEHPLAFATFTSDARKLRLDRVFASMLADRALTGSDDTWFRIVLRDTPPVDAQLAALLKAPVEDPGPFVSGAQTTRLTFSEQALWTYAAEIGSEFEFLARGADPLSPEDLRWVCQRLLIELRAPAASGDLTTPGDAEQTLLSRVRSDVGAEAFPNMDRSATDVAAAMIGSARAARQGRLEITPQELLRRAQLRSDFGAVARAHPVDRSVAVERAAASPLVDLVRAVSATGGLVTITGPPGQGKSWLCQQLIEALSRDGWLIAEHYCYLGDADADRSTRVLAETIFGSLLGRLAQTDPRLVEDQRPRFAADEDALFRGVTRSLEVEPDRPVALIIDGLDHISRLRPHSADFDPARTLAEVLASIDLPSGSVMVILSQPGTHLVPFEQAGSQSLTVPGMDDDELKLLAERLGAIPALMEDDAAGTTSVTDFVAALHDRSAGNALYATYLCREALRRDVTAIDLPGSVLSFPPFDEHLEGYYEYLYAGLGSETAWVADVIALMDFAVTRAELRDIRPDAAHRVDPAIERLRPVLVERAAQGGVRVYHESFARYLRRPFLNDATALSALLDRIASWLKRKGFYSDERAFRFLLPTLADAGRDQEVVDLTGEEFVTHAIGAGFPASAIRRNLATAIGSASRIDQWAAVVRYVELSRAVEAYETERFESHLVEFVDVLSALLTPDIVAERLLFEDRTVVPARAGLQVCAAVDALGAVAPWQAYLDAYVRESESDNTSYGEASDQAVAVASLRGQLRLAATRNARDLGMAGENPTGGGDQVHERAHEPTGSTGNAGSSETVGQRNAEVDWDALATWVLESDLAAEAIDAVVDTLGLAGAISLIAAASQRGQLCLALAERVADDGELASSGSAGDWATAAALNGIEPGLVHRVLKLGGAVEPLISSAVPLPGQRERLLSMTRQMQERGVRWKDTSPGEWLDRCAIAARNDKLGLNAAEALIAGEGWYRCWLRFAIGLVIAEAAEPEARSGLAASAIGRLTDDLNPFAGDPRSCDLYSLHHVIADTVRRAVALVDDAAWEPVMVVLERVSASITTSMFGESGGPLPPGFVLRVAVEQANSSRRSVVADMLVSEIENGAAGRFYSDLAEYRLVGARLAIASADRDEASRLWMEACEYLTAYGWHKDITIYELLDPFSALIAADLARARLRLTGLQQLCERVPLHTDLKETRHARSRWWQLLAKADPCALARLAARRIFVESNEPNHLLHESLAELWREWWETADPVVAGALRLTIDSTLEVDDVGALQRLLATVREGEKTEAEARLPSFLLARFDERPVAYSYTNGDEQLAKDDAQVADINRLAEEAGLPTVGVLRDAPQTHNSSRDWGAGSSLTRPGISLAIDGFAPGARGLASAIREWRRRPYDAAGHEWSVDRFVNVIGYRIVELAQIGRDEEARFAVRALAEASSLGDRSGILAAVAKGLDRFGRHQEAAVAYALAWTRARGQGGWLTFGGETELDSLRKATELDPAATLSIVAEEVQHVVAGGRYGTYGVSQALIQAFAAGALKPASGAPLDVAFAAWDEAFAVISRRAPRVDPSDDPEDPYVPGDASEDPPLVVSELDAVCALAALAGFADPAREKKRRSLLATVLLLSERPSACTLAIEVALSTVSDPASLTWLLRILDLAGDQARPAIASARDALAALAGSQYLTVRALARRLCDGVEPPVPPPAPADRTLVNRDLVELWLPEGAEPESDDAARYREMVATTAGGRLRLGEPLLPGIRAGVEARVANASKSDAHRRRMRIQLDALADRVEKRWPDAYLSTDQIVEEALQLSAAGGRAARLAVGEAVSDPATWEDQLATVLLDDPTLCLALESQREPRPSIAPPPPAGHELWLAVRRAPTEGAEDSPIQFATEEGGLLLATVCVESATRADVVRGGPFNGWRVLGEQERRVFRHPDWRKREEELHAERYRVVEVRVPGDRRAFDRPPISNGDVKLWLPDEKPRVSLAPVLKSHPLVGEDQDLTALADSVQGLGAPMPVLTPSPSLLNAVGVRGGKPFVLDDKRGPALALLTWRADYDTSEYRLNRPRTRGSRIVIRPDLFEQLIGAFNDLLIVREFVLGDSELATPPE